MHIASKRNLLPIATLLVENNADTNIQDPDGVSPLHAAAGFNNTDVMALLIDAKAELDKPDKYGYTPIFDTVWSKQMPAFDSLLKAKATVSITSDAGDGILHAAAHEENFELIAKALSLKLVDPNLKNHKGETYQQILQNKAKEKTQQAIKEGKIMRPQFHAPKPIQFKKDDSDGGNDQRQQYPATLITRSLKNGSSVVIDPSHIFGLPIFDRKKSKLNGWHYTKPTLELGMTILVSATETLTVMDINKKAKNAGFYTAFLRYENSDPAIPVTKHRKTFFSPDLSDEEVLGSACQTLENPDFVDIQPGKICSYGTYFPGLNYNEITVKAITVPPLKRTHPHRLKSFHPVLDKQELATLALLKKKHSQQSTMSCQYKLPTKTAPNRLA